MQETIVHWETSDDISYHLNELTPVLDPKITSWDNNNEKIEIRVVKGDGKMMAY